LCSWYHPTRFGREEVSRVLRGRDQELAAGFRAARPGEASGRVRITASGFVITNRQENNAVWKSIFVGRIDPASLGNWDSWIAKEWR
jgi:hypothetical protein